MRLHLSTKTMPRNELSVPPRIYRGHYPEPARPSRNARPRSCRALRSDTKVFNQAPHQMSQVARPTESPKSAGRVIRRSLMQKSPVQGIAVMFLLWFNTSYKWSSQSKGNKISDRVWVATSARQFFGHLLLSSNIRTQ